MWGPSNEDIRLFLRVLYVAVILVFAAAFALGAWLF